MISTEEFPPRNLQLSGFQLIAQDGPTTHPDLLVLRDGQVNKMYTFIQTDGYTEWISILNERQMSTF